MPNKIGQRQPIGKSQPDGSSQPSASASDPAQGQGQQPQLLLPTGESGTTVSATAAGGEVILDALGQVLKRRCTCQDGKCIKKYCICLKAGIKCDPKVCQCRSCENDETHAAHERRKEQLVKIRQGVMKRGCNCRKSGCGQKYCVCYAQGLKCSNLCHCQKCNNCETDHSQSHSQSQSNDEESRQELGNNLPAGLELTTGLSMAESHSHSHSNSHSHGQVVQNQDNLENTGMVDSEMAPPVSSTMVQGNGEEEPASRLGGKVDEDEDENMDMDMEPKINKTELQKFQKNQVEKSAQPQMNNKNKNNPEETRVDDSKASVVAR